MTVLTFNALPIQVQCPPVLTPCSSNPDTWINSGDSAVVAPDGQIVAGPMHDEYGILYADIDADVSSALHRTLDVAGHYGRPDVFSLTVDRSPQNPIVFT